MHQNSAVQIGGQNAQLNSDFAAVDATQMAQLPVPVSVHLIVI